MGWGTIHESPRLALAGRGLSVVSRPPSSESTYLLDIMCGRALPYHGLGIVRFTSGENVNPGRYSTPLYSPCM